MISRYVELDRQSLDVRQGEIYDAIVSGPRGRILPPHHILLQSAELAEPAQQLGAILRYGTSLPGAITELVILTVARHWDAHYEWEHHAPIARNAGLSGTVMHALAAGDESIAFDDASQELAHRIARDTLCNHPIDDKTFAAGVATFGKSGLVEILVTTGYYTMLAFLLRAHHVGEDGVENDWAVPAPR